MNRLLPLLPILCFFALIQPAFPWGAQGHQAVGEVARGVLTPAARAKTNEILANDDLASVGTWLDDVRHHLEFGPATLKPDEKIKRIEILPPKDYDEQQLPRVKMQLEKSCVHLAQLLNSVGFE